MASGMMPACARSARRRGLSLARTSSGLAEAIGDATFGQVIGRHLDHHLVAGQHADAVLAHLAGGMGDNHVAIGAAHAEGRVGQQFARRCLRIPAILPWPFVLFKMRLEKCVAVFRYGGATRKCTPSNGREIALKPAEIKEFQPKRAAIWRSQRVPYGTVCGPPLLARALRTPSGPRCANIPPRWPPCGQSRALRSASGDRVTIRSKLSS